MLAKLRIFKGSVQYLLTSLALFAAAYAHASGGISFPPNPPVCYPPPPSDNCCAPMLWWIEADYLYWRACEDGLDAGLVSTIDTPTPNGSTTTFTEHTKDLDFQWNSGFRVGIGQGLPIFSGWQAALYYTHYNTTAHRRCEEDFQSNWKLHFDMYDVVFGRDIWFNCKTNLNVFAGVRGAIIKQHFHLFRVDTLVAPQATTLTEVDQKAHTKFTGLGPRIGVEAEWMTFCDLSLYGYVAVSALFGHFSVDFEELGVAPEALDDCRVNRSLSFCQAVTDIGLGVRWQYVSCCGFKTGVQIGFEHHQFFKQNKICDCGDLYLDGLVASVTFGF